MANNDIIGCRFGSLVVAEAHLSRPHHYICQCDCGRMHVSSKYNLQRGAISSCGCLRSTNLVGRRFFKLLVLAKTVNAWHCLCDCGKECVVDAAYLRNWKYVSCGCHQISSDLTGQRFGRLIVQEVTRDSFGRKAWLCVCECGQSRIVRTYELRFGDITHCGCEFADRNHLQRADNSPFLKLRLCGRQIWIGGHYIPRKEWRCDCGESVDRILFFFDGRRRDFLLLCQFCAQDATHGQHDKRTLSMPLSEYLQLSAVTAEMWANRESTK